MKVISISTDRKIFQDNSSVFLRTKEYAKGTEEFNVVIFSKKSHGFSEKHVGNLHIYPTNSFSRFSYIFDAIKIGKRIIVLKKLNSGGVISTQDPFETGFVGKKLKKLFNLPLQVQAHTDFFSKNFKSSFLNIIRIFLAKMVLPKADEIRVVSESIKASIKKHFPNIKAEIDVLPVFVDIEKIVSFVPKRDLSKDFPDFKFIILMASRLTPEKRIHVALRAFKRVLIQFPHAGLVIAGEGSEKNNLKNLASRLGIEKSVVFLGWQDDLISLYKTSDLFLLTSEYEGYGMTLIEAGASGLPIVTTPVGVTNTALFKSGENSFVCGGFDVSCIYKDIVSIISDNGKRELFKHKMQDSIREQKMTETEYVEKYLGFLKSLVK